MFDWLLWHKLETEEDGNNNTTKTTTTTASKQQNKTSHSFSSGLSEQKQKEEIDEMELM